MISIGGLVQFMVSNGFYVSVLGFVVFFFLLIFVVFYDTASHA